MKILLSLVLLLSSLSAVAANPNAVIHTNMGTLTLELYAEKAPVTVANFVQYARDGFYDGLIFHRLIPNYMLQGGAYQEDYSKREEGLRAPITSEAYNGLQNLRGMVAMARGRGPHSASSQFFINLANNPALDYKGNQPNEWGYTVFAKVVKGQDVLARIESTPTGGSGPFDKYFPNAPVLIEKVEIIGDENLQAVKPATPAPVAKKPSKPAKKPAPAANDDKFATEDEIADDAADYAEDDAEDDKYLAEDDAEYAKDEAMSDEELAAEDAEAEEAYAEEEEQPKAKPAKPMHTAQASKASVAPITHVPAKPKPAHPVKSGAEPKLMTRPVAPVLDAAFEPEPPDVPAVP